MTAKTLENKNVRKSALKITKKWLQIKKDNPKLLPHEIAKMLEEEISLNAMNNEEEYCDTKFKITKKWLQIRKDNPKLLPHEIAKIIAEEISLNAINNEEEPFSS